MTEQSRETSHVDRMARQAGIPGERQFLEEVLGLVRSPGPPPSPSAAFALLRVGEFRKIQKRLPASVYAAMMFQIMLDYYQNRLGARRSPEFARQAEQAGQEIALRYADCPEVAAARDLYALIMRTQLDEPLKFKGIDTLRQHLDFKAQQGQLRPRN